MDAQSIKDINKIYTDLEVNIKAKKEALIEALRSADEDYDEVIKNKKQKYFDLLRQTSNYCLFFNHQSPDDIKDNDIMFDFMFYMSIIDDLIEKLGKDRVAFFDAILDFVAGRKLKELRIDILGRYEILMKLFVGNNIEKTIILRNLAATATQQATTLYTGEKPETFAKVVEDPEVITKFLPELEDNGLCSLVDKSTGLIIPWKNIEESYLSTLRLAICVFAVVSRLYEEDFKKKIVF